MSRVDVVVDGLATLGLQVEQFVRGAALQLRLRAVESLGRFSEVALRGGVLPRGHFGLVKCGGELPGRDERPVGAASAAGNTVRDVWQICPDGGQH
jgi:hypothetical protein